MSSHWHYQLMYHKYEHPQLGEAGYYAIHEYYEMDGEGSWTEDPVDVTCNSIEGVKRSLRLMLQDIDKHGVKDYEV